MKKSPVGAEIFYVGWQTDGRTDMTKLTVAVRKFTNGSEVAVSIMTASYHTGYFSGSIL